MDEGQVNMPKFKDIASPENGNRRLRINKTTGESLFFVSRFNDNCEINKLSGPISFIAKDENDFSDQLMKGQGNENYHWLLKNSGNEKIKINNKSYISKKCNLDTDVFFVLVENEEYSDLYPISSWHIFEPDISEKTMNKFNKEEAYEKWKKEKSEKDKKLDEILERLRQKEENEKPVPKRGGDRIREKGRRIKGSFYNGEEEGDDDDDDNIPLEKQEKKKLKNLLKLKRGDDKDEIDYVDSALAITSLRKNMVDWDYSDDGKKSDDEDLNDVGSAPEDLEDDDENDNSDDNENNADSNLTFYGQAVRTLLKQQINDEEDDELDQYSDDDDEQEEESEREQEKKKKRKRIETPQERKGSSKKREKQKEKHKKRKKQKEEDSDEDSENDDEEDDDEDDNGSEEDSDEDSDEGSDEDSDEGSDEESDDSSKNEKEKQKRKKQMAKTNENNFNEITMEKFRKNKIQITKENCAKIIYTIIEKNNGKMEISLLLNILNIKEKNQSFILVQKAIKTLCNISSQMKENKKVKMVSIKPKYLKK